MRGHGAPRPFRPVCPIRQALRRQCLPSRRRLRRRPGLSYAYASGRARPVPENCAVETTHFTRLGWLVTGVGGSVTLVTHRKKGRALREQPPAPLADANLAAAALLYDMAALQPTERSRFGYKRAAKAIAGLPVAVTDLVAAGTLREVPFVGPASERIVTEFVTQGSSPTVDAAIAKAGNPRAVQEKRAFRDGYLSHTVLAAALEAPAADGVVSRADYRGDFPMPSTYSDGTE